jgi:hypothetical protein
MLQTRTVKTDRKDIKKIEMVLMSLKMVNLEKTGRSISFRIWYNDCQYILSLVTFSIAGILFLVAKKCLC